jgi:hypothetical protein
MGADKQAFDAAFKDVLEGGISEGVNNKMPLKDVIKTESVPFKGREIVRLAHTSRNISPMFVGEDSAFADAGQQGYVRQYVDQKKMMARIRLTWEVMQDSTSSEGAFLSARKSEMNYLIDDIARRDEYALCSDGRGVLALVDESPSGTTLDVDAPGGVTNDNFGNRYLSAGMYIGAVNPATNALRSTIHRVVSTPAAGSTIVVDSSTHTGWADNDYIVQVANSSVTDINDTSYEKAWWGLMALIDDGTYRNSYFGIDRSAFPAFSSYVTASTGALSTDLIQRVSDVVDQKLGGRISLILCHHSTRRLVIQLTDADRRYMGSSLMKPDAGTVAFKQGDVPFGDVPVRAIRDFPLDVMMFLDVENSGFKQYVSEPGKWADEAGGGVLKQIGSGSTARDAFEAWYRVRKQYFCENPGFSARLDGVTGQSLVVQRASGS